MSWLDSREAAHLPWCPIQRGDIHSLAEREVTQIDPPYKELQT